MGDPEFFRCGVCGARFNTEQEVRTHTETGDGDGEAHDGEPWYVTNDDLCIIARTSVQDSGYGESSVPWSFFGSWRFNNDCDFAKDEAIGWQVRQLFRMGYVEVRVLHREEAERMCDRHVPRNKSCRT